MPRCTTSIRVRKNSCHISKRATRAFEVDNFKQFICSSEFVFFPCFFPSISSNFHILYSSPSFLLLCLLLLSACLSFVPSFVRACFLACLVSYFLLFITDP